MDNKYLSNANAYHDISDLQRLRTGAKNHDDQALVAVAKQLEGTFLNMMLKSMREANSAFGEGNPLNSKEAEFYQGMFDQQISLTMAQGKGFGLADMIVKQMRGMNQDQSKVEELMGTNATVKNIEQVGIPLERANSAFLLDDKSEGFSLPEKKTEYLLPIDRVRAMAQTVNNDAVHIKNSNTIDSKLVELNTLTTNAVDKKLAKETNVLLTDNKHVEQPSTMLSALRTLFPTAAAFVDVITPYAKAAANELGIDTNAIVAQAALETGWGNHVIAGGDGKSSFNFFGIKSSASWSGDSEKVSTLEYKNGIAEKEFAEFRSYKSMDDAFQDYVSFLKDNPRYKDALENTQSAKDWGFQLQHAGYATDPEYGKKIASIVSRLDRSDGNDKK